MKYLKWFAMIYLGWALLYYLLNRKTTTPVDAIKHPGETILDIPYYLKYLLGGMK